MNNRDSLRKPWLPMKTKTRQRCMLVAIILLVAAGGLGHHAIQEDQRGRRIQQYEKLLDAQWIDKDCTLEYCPKSSKSLPGMPPDRAAFTRYERFNLKWRGDYVTLSAPVIDFRVYRVTKTNDGTLEAIVGIGITRCAIDSDGYSFTTDIRKITLAPSTIAVCGGMKYLQMSSSRSRLSWKRPAVVALISLRTQLVSRAYPLF